MMKEINLRTAIYEASRSKDVDLEGITVDELIRQDHEFWTNAKANQFNSDQDFLDKVLESLKSYKEHFRLEDALFEDDEMGQENLVSGHGGFPSLGDSDRKGFFYNSLEESIRFKSNTVDSIIHLIKNFSDYILKVEMERCKKRVAIEDNQRLTIEDKESKLDSADIEAKDYLYAFPAPTKEENQCVGGHESRLRNAYFKIDGSDIAVRALETVLNKLTSQLAEAKMKEEEFKGQDLIDDSIKIHINPALRKLIGFNEDAIADKNYQYVIDAMGISEAINYLVHIDELLDKELLSEAVSAYKDELANFEAFDDEGQLSVAYFADLNQHWQSIEAKNGFGFNLNHFAEYTTEVDQSKFPQGALVLKKDLKEIENSILLEEIGDSYLGKRIKDKKVYHRNFLSDQTICKVEGVIDIANLIKGEEADDRSIASGLFGLYLLSQKFDGYRDNIFQFIAIMTVLEFDKGFDDIKSADLATDAYFRNLKKAILARTKEYLREHFAVKFSDQTLSIYDSFFAPENNQAKSDLYDNFSNYFISYLDDETFIHGLNSNEVFKGILLDCVSQKTGESFLMRAIERNSTALVSYIIEQGADIDFVSSKNGYSPVINAVTNANIHALRLLIQNGVDLNKIYYAFGNDQSDNLGNVMHFLYEVDDTEDLGVLMEVLIDGINPEQIDYIINGCDGQLRTPLHLSLGRNAFNVAEKLLEYDNVRVDLVDGLDRSLLHQIVSPIDNEVNFIIDEDRSFELLRKLINKIERKGKLDVLSYRDDNNKQTALDLIASEIEEGQQNQAAFRLLFGKMSVEQIRLPDKYKEEMPSPMEKLIINARSDQWQGVISGILFDAIAVGDSEKVDFIVKSFESVDLYNYTHVDTILKEVRAVIEQSKLGEDHKSNLLDVINSLTLVEEVGSPVDDMSIVGGDTPGSAFGNFGGVTQEQETDVEMGEGDSGQEEEGEQISQEDASSYSDEEQDVVPGADPNIPEPGSPAVARRLDFGPGDIGDPPI